MVSTAELPHEVPLRDQFEILRRRWWIVAVGAVLGLGAASALSVLQSPSYQAHSQLLFQFRTSDPLSQPVSVDDSKRELNNELRQMESTAARELVRNTYTGPLNVDDVTATVASTDADVITVSVTSNDAAEAARLVNVYAQKYIEFRRQTQIDRLGTYANGVISQINDLKANIDNLNLPLAALDARIAREPSSSTEIGSLRTQRDQLVAQLSPQLTSLQSQLLFLQQELGKIELSSTLTRAGDVSILESAEVPTAPVSPRPTRNAVLGLVVGLLLGVGAAFVREQFDDVVRDREAFESVTGLPVLGLIPQLKGRKSRPERDLAALRQPNSTFSEAFRTLRTAVKFFAIDRPVQLIQITSAVAAEGKTTITGNLAVVMAQTGASVVVVGCDLRRPGLDTLWQVPQGPGLTNVLLGEARLSQAIWKHPEIASLDILRTGPLPPNPSEMLGSSQATELLKSLRSLYDIVILDCPPVLPVADSLILASHVDITLLVATEGLTTKKDLERAIEMLRQVDASLAGAILNRASQLDGAGYRPLPASEKRNLASQPWDDQLDDLISAFVAREENSVFPVEADEPDPANGVARYRPAGSATELRASATEGSRERKPGWSTGRPS
jgi:succinoglycan biosynthesis transport protein ExoP